MRKGFVRIDRALSKLGIASRVMTRQWILERRLQADGVFVSREDVLVCPEKTLFSLDGRPLQSKKEQLIALHKPKGFVTTRKDEKGRKTVYDLMPVHLQHLHPIGRLDMQTTGLLLFTSSTKLSAKMTNPQNQIQRVYLVSVRGEIGAEDISQLTEGVWDLGELLQAQEVILRKISRRESHLVVTLTEGKNREIRRMFKALSHEVTALKRVSFGVFHLGDLPLGCWKELSIEN